MPSGQDVAAGTLQQDRLEPGRMGVITVDHLRKTYRRVVAVDDLSFEVEAGEIFGILGPNGAGKTTTVECIQGLRRPDGGTIRVLGLDPATQAFDTLSGGQRQRLFIALAFVNSPEVVFLDELTQGLDPQARRATWELIREIRRGGTTVVLVTHFMDEAEHLCDRVAVLDRGRWPRSTPRSG